MKRFGEKLRILRKRQGLTVRELGNMIDVHYTYISKIEIGKTGPSPSAILKLADVFEVTADALMRDELEIE